MKFECVKDCSQCCIEREYFPSKRYGKIGVLVLPEEKQKIEELAKHLEIKIKIIPRIGISKLVDKKQIKILGYQLMGIEDNGNTCPFLDTKSDLRSPHGGFTCKIYEHRPLACRAYPLIETEPIILDEKCKFCKECGHADENLHKEIESLLRIKDNMNSDFPYIWRYATNVGEKEDQDEFEEGWILEE
jgi:Fe-S-cluster containining protein